MRHEKNTDTIEPHQWKIQNAAKAKEKLQKGGIRATVKKKKNESQTAMRTYLNEREHTVKGPGGQHSLIGIRPPLRPAPKGEELNPTT